jgi:ribose transport system permease protein
VIAPATPSVPDHENRASFAKRLGRALSVRKIGALYVLIIISIIFSIWAPALFPRWATVLQIVNSNAIGALAALTLIFPLSAGVFDLSEAYTMSLTGVVVAVLVVNHNVPFWLAILAALGFAFMVGMLNVGVVVIMKIDSFIGTLATGSLVVALIALVSGGNTIAGVQLFGGFAKIAQGKFLGFVYPVWYALILAVIVWYVFEYTAFGRRLYATGFNKRAARLAGVQTDWLQAITLIVGAVVAGLIGIVLASFIGAGSGDIGTPYLLTSFAAVFLGATQVKEGRFNAPGTIIAILLLGTGETGLTLANAPSWTGSAFTGVVLIAALAVTGLQRRKVGFGAKVETTDEAHAEATEIQIDK